MIVALPGLFSYPFSTLCIRLFRTVGLKRLTEVDTNSGGHPFQIKIDSLLKSGPIPFLKPVHLDFETLFVERPLCN